MVKRTDAANDWGIIDNLRKASSQSYKLLAANLSDAEDTGANYVDITSTGFTIKQTSAFINASGGTYIYMAFADKREYAYWLDQSGNNNDWTSNNLTESDISVDSPTNNFATMNPLIKHTNVATTYSEGNLKIYKAATYWTSTVATMYVDSGKWYAEFCNLTDGVYQIFGISAEGDSIKDKHPGATSAGFGYSYVFDTAAGRGDITYQDATVSTGGAFNNLAVGTIIGITLDFDNNQVKFYANNVLQYTQTIGARAYTYSLAPHGGYIVANFGQDSSFAGNKTAQGNQDGNDIGDFYYTPPTGFLALCTSNLPAVAVVPSEHFNTITYTGNNGASGITGVGFQPDFAWFKARNLTEGHMLFDAVRGAAKTLFSNTTGAENTSYTNVLSAFNADGYTLGSNEGVNHSSGNYVAWNWKANGSGSSNTNGSITSTVSANVDAGFSIVSYTGNGTAGATIGHGLSKAPEMVIVKSRSLSGKNWPTYHIATGNTNRTKLNATDATGSSSAWNNTTPSASLITLGSQSEVNTASATQIAYCFHSVDGYSKVGSYTGNGNADGTFVYTGFRPMFVTTKVTSDAHHWTIYNTDKATYNHDATTAVYANTDNAEGTGAASTRRIDLLSNGFKLRHNSYDGNANGQNYIYIAFAESPFKFSNAR
jgi:hypothetical protein